MKKDITAGSFRHGQNVCRCRGCQDKHVKNVRFSNHQNLEKLEAEVLDYLAKGVEENFFGYYEISREAVSRHFEVPEHQAEQVFQSLKIKGYLGTAENRAPHDSKRDMSPMGGGWDNSWMGSLWPIRVANVVRDKLNHYEGFGVSYEVNQDAGKKFVAMKGETILQAGNYKLLKDLVDNQLEMEARMRRSANMRR